MLLNLNIRWGANIWGIVRPLRFIRLNSQSRWLDRQSNDYYTREAKVQNLRSRAAFKLMEIDDKFHFFNKDKAQRVLDLGFAPGAWSQVARQRVGSKGMVLGVDILPCDPPRGVHSIQANILSVKTQELVRLYFSRYFQLYKNDELHKHHGYFQDSLEDELHNIRDTETYREIFDSSLVTSKTDRYPVDVVISDMYECWPQTTGFWNNLTNLAYYRMANTSGVAVRDHYQSIDLGDAALVTAIDLLKPQGNFVCKLYTGKEDKLFEKRLRRVFQRVNRFKPDASRNESKEIYFVGLRKKDFIDKLDVFMN